MYTSKSSSQSKQIAMLAALQKGAAVNVEAEFIWSQRVPDSRSSARQLDAVSTGSQFNGHFTTSNELNDAETQRDIVDELVDKSITDPRGEVMYYVYDEFNRLKFVKNTEGEILKEHSYNYKN